MGGGGKDEEGKREKVIQRKKKKWKHELYVCQMSVIIAIVNKTNNQLISI